MCKWIPIKHSFACGTDVIVSELPKDGEAVFVTCNGTKMRCDTFLILPGGKEDFVVLGIEYVEAWMRFPKPYNPNNLSSLWVPIEHNPNDEQHPVQRIALPNDGERVLITVNEGFIQTDIFRIKADGTIGFDRVPIDNVTAWMTLPAPYVPRTCGNCRYGVATYDDDGFRWTDCQLLEDGVFSNTRPIDCPLKKEVNHGSN